MSDAARRSIRSFIQIGLVESFLQLTEAFGLHLTQNQHAAIIVFLTPVLVLVQNLLEDSGAIPSALKAQASSGKHPITHDPAK